jgi:hypothetical protein
MKIWILIILAGFAMIAGACSDTFLVYKQGKGYFLGSNSSGKYELLCASGDMEKVLADTHLSAEMKDSLYKYNCSAERSGEKIQEIYLSMNAEQRKDIRTAFKKNGYEINHGPECCGP